MVGPQAAGSLIYRKSRPGVPVPSFHTSDTDALQDLRQCAQKEAVADAEALAHKEQARLARNLARRQARAKAKKETAEALQRAARELELLIAA
jgi:type IV secretory pathway TrbL component